MDIVTDTITDAHEAKLLKRLLKQRLESYTGIAYSELVDICTMLESRKTVNAMKTFSGGVRYYTKSTVEIYFPEDDLCCYRCPLMGMEYKPEREYCKRTGEYLTAPRDVVGFNCPLKFENSEGDNEHG